MIICACGDNRFQAIEVEDKIEIKCYKCGNRLIVFTKDKIELDGKFKSNKLV